MKLRRSVPCLAAAAFAAACSSSTSPMIKPLSDAAPDPVFCNRGMNVPSVTPPAGFCLKHYNMVTEARTLALAPNGDLFVGAPKMGTPGGASGGPGAIMVLSDDDHDGTAEETLFAGNLDDVHGIAVGGGYVYFTTKDNVWRTPYVDGQRTENLAARESLGLPGGYGLGGRWTHGLARSPAGQLVTSRGEYGQCGNSHGGDISTIESGGALTTLATGLRNPMYLRCHAKDEVCAAMELGDDQREGAREKMIMLRMGTDYGFPCCHSTGVLNTEMMGVTCDDITMEDSAFKLSETPFGFDWEPGVWPEPYKNAVFVALHGSAYATPTWAGTRIVYAATDPQTHKPVQEWQDFLTGFGIGGSVLDRATDIVFSPDGRMFFADDTSGRVYWMAPKDLLAP